MLRKWALNASPIIALGKIDRLNLINELCQEIVIPKGVAEEIAQGPPDDQDLEWLRQPGKDWVRDVGDIKQLITAWDLGQGESEVLNWAYLHPEFEAGLDDRAARNCAAAMNIKVKGTIGNILLAKKEKRIALVSPILIQLAEAGLRIDPSLFHTAKKLAGEE